MKNIHLIPPLFSKSRVIREFKERQIFSILTIGHLKSIFHNYKNYSNLKSKKKIKVMIISISACSRYGTQLLAGCQSCFQKPFSWLVFIRMKKGTFFPAIQKRLNIDMWKTDMWKIFKRTTFHELFSFLPAAYLFSAKLFWVPT